MAMANPPPMHQPRMAAMTGLPIVSTRSTTRRPSSRKRTASSAARGPPARSAPAENALVPEPVSTMQRVASRASSASSAASTSCISAGDTAFAAGVLEEDGVVRHAGNHTIKSPPRETEAAMASAKRENIQPPSLHQRVVSGHLLYSHVVAVEGRRMVFISGQLARDRDGNVVGRHDMRAQLRQVGENLKAALAAAGATLGDLVKTTTFVTDIDEYFKHVDVRMEYFGAALPASTTVEVRKLAHADLPVEVEAIAITA